MVTTQTEIEICMGSSCFCRGNRSHLKIIQEFIKEHNLEEKVVLKGALCQGHCGSGPHLKINETLYNDLDPDKTVILLEEQFLNK